ncbi:response regulator [Caldalkalibacillus mannanilyticus]|uniref:response regulator n=1 Tax=Caldalkalibacillus mannanilyticus TaxID=1418 RepID=UPI0004682AB5|nr:response regulator [Caldalkalibacillus mannanilyticus]
MKAILIDDEKLALDYLQHQLASVATFEIVGKFTDPLEALESMEQLDADIIFLDIHIPEMNGIELAEKIVEKKPEVNIVFVTAHDNFAVKAFELNALDYILKPVRKERLLNTIQRIKQRVETMPDPAFLKTTELHMSMFQQVCLSDGKQDMTSLQWRTTKAQQLFLYLVHQRGKVVSKAEIIELLWEEYEPKKAYAQLYTTIYHVRKTTEVFGSHFRIRNVTEGYLMTLDGINLDVDEFEQFLEKNLPLAHETISDFEQIMSLYKGEYLQGYDYLWAESERQRLQLLWLRTSLKMVEWYFSVHELEKAMKHCLEICERCPLEEDAYFFLMKIGALMGNRTLVHQYYSRLKTILMDELNEQPNSTITEWYHTWNKK